MDTLRQITSSWDGTLPLDQNDHQQLITLESQLKQYLPTRDALRAFTPETLDARLKKQASTDLHVQNPAGHSLIIVIITSLLAGGTAFIIPPYDLTITMRALVSIPLFFLGLHIGIAWFYLTALRNFNENLRRSFRYLCAGIILLSLGFSHYVVLQLFDLGRYPAFKYGGITWLLSVPFAFMFFGLRIYAKLLGVKSRLISLPVVAGLTAAVAGGLMFIPHRPASEEILFDVGLIGAAMIPLFGLMSAILAHHIRKAVTQAYAKSMTWLYRYMLLVGLGAILASAFLVAFGELRGTALMLVTAVCGTPPQLLLLYTGYSFKKETGQ